MTIEEFVAGKDPWHVGAEHFPPVYFVNKSLDEYDEQSMKVFDNCEENIRDLLNGYDIGCTSLTLQYVWPKDTRDKGLDTIVINTADETEDKKSVGQAQIGNLKS